MSDLDRSPDDDWDTDSTLGSEPPSTTASLSSSILNYQYENGRRYHAYKAGKYPIPNDEREQDRLDFTHHIYSMLLKGELYTAPLESAPKRVLDVGTGTGIWAIDMADKFPDCMVIGTDLSAIQPTFVPPNVQFEIDDCEQDWLYSQPLDLIHMRALGGSIADWPKLYKRAYDKLAPGGWIQVTEFETWCSTDDDSLPKSSSLYQYMIYFSEAAAKFGKIMNIAPEHEKLCNEAGFEAVVDTQIKVLLSAPAIPRCPLTTFLPGQAPLSPWPEDKKQKHISRYVQASMLDSLESYGIALFTRALGWSLVDTQLFLVGVRNDLHNLDHHIYTRCHFVHGRKPKGP